MNYTPAYFAEPAPTQTGVPVNAPALEVEITILEKCLYELEENLGGLECRLLPVLLPDQPSPVRPDAVPSGNAEIHSAAVAKVKALRVSVVAMINRTKDVTGRLEV